MMHLLIKLYMNRMYCKLVLCTIYRKSITRDKSQFNVLLYELLLYFGTHLTINYIIIIYVFYYSHYSFVPIIIII